MNLYTRLSTFKAASNVTDHIDDPMILQTLTAASRGFDGALNRVIYPERATRIFDAEGGELLLLNSDVLSVQSLSADGSALTEGTDYLLYPYNKRPASAVVRLGGKWPTGRAKVSITGVFGVADTTAPTGATVGNETTLSGSGTELDLAVAADVEAGDMLVIESEDIYVIAVSEEGEDETAKLVASVVRACNGTTAAAHANGTPIRRRTYPAGLEEACILQTSRMLTGKATGGANVVGDPDLGGFSFGALYPAIQDLLQPFRRYGVH